MAARTPPTLEIRRGKITFNDDLTGSEAAQSAVACEITVVPLKRLYLSKRVFVCIHTHVPKAPIRFLWQSHTHRKTLPDRGQAREVSTGGCHIQSTWDATLGPLAGGSQGETEKSAIFWATHFNKILILLQSWTISQLLLLLSRLVLAMMSSWQVQYQWKRTKSAQTG